MQLLSHTAMVFVGDSDDSDTEGGLGNVERVVMRPPGHSGKAKRGHLCFNAAFETGNLGRVDFITENEYDLFIRPDTCNPRIRFWFHFSVENVQKNQRIIFNIVNLSKTRNLFQRGMAPVVRSTTRPKWQRLPSNQVYYYRSPEHSNAYVLSMAFAFDREEEEQYFFALSFPYSYTRCMRILDEIQRKRQDVMKLEMITKTVQGRDVPMVTVRTECDPKVNIGEPAEEDDASPPPPPDEESDLPKARPTIIVIARSHPGDSNTSYVIQGMIEFLTSEHTIARELREHIDFILFPMLNPDGVFLGNSRSTLLGVDLNRAWQRLTLGVPELHDVREYILRASKERRLDFVLDLHGSSSLTGLFVQGNSFDSVYRFERHLVFPKLLAQNCPDFETENSMYNADGDKEGTCRRFVSANTSEGGTNTFSVEVSLHGYRNDEGVTVAYSEEDYLMHGRRISRSLWEYFKVTNVIESAVTATPAAAAATTTTAAASDATNVKENSFSMIRLRSIARHKDIFSSLESFSDDAPSSSSSSCRGGDSTPNSRRKRKGKKVSAAFRRRTRAASGGSSSRGRTNGDKGRSEDDDDEEEEEKPRHNHFVRFRRVVSGGGGGGSRTRRDQSSNAMSVVGRNIESAKEDSDSDFRLVMPSGGSSDPGESTPAKSNADSAPSSCPCEVATETTVTVSEVDVPTVTVKETRLGPSGGRGSSAAAALLDDYFRPKKPPPPDHDDDGRGLVSVMEDFVSGVAEMVPGGGNTLFFFGAAAMAGFSYYLWSQYQAPFQTPIPHDCAHPAGSLWFTTPQGEEPKWKFPLKQQKEKMFPDEEAKTD